MERKGEMRDLMMFIDAETDGLYGDFISVGIIVANHQGEIIQQEYYGIKKELLDIKDEWTKEHVIPILGEYQELESQEELLEETWRIWERYRKQANVVADVTYPVECRLFQECVKLKPIERKMQGPFPLMDLSSMMYAKGLDPLIEREKLVELENTVTRHNALYDVQLSMEIWKKYIKTTD